MRSLFSTITKKVIIGYLMVVIFSLSAVGFALSHLHQQTNDTKYLVNVEFRLFELVRDMQQNLLAQENIEKQLLILRDPALSELRLNRNREFARYVIRLNSSPAAAKMQYLINVVASYHKVEKQLSELLFWEDWPLAQKISTAEIIPLRVKLLNHLANLRQQQQQNINTGLAQLSLRTEAAFQMTGLLALIGILLSAPVSVVIILSVHRSVRALKEAIQQIASGSFEHRPDLTGDDEFAQLASDFTRMGEKLRELEKLQLDANPLTQLPGNLAIDRDIEMRIGRGEHFSHLYIDLDNFKAYSDRYGYKSGSDVLAKVGELIKQVVGEYGSLQDLIGHIGGDDYVVISSLKSGELLAQEIVTAFDKLAPSFYNSDDKKAGSFSGEDRYGVKRNFPLMTISIAVIVSDNYKYPSRLAISQDCARVKEYLKVQEGSNYMLERRR